MHRNLYLQSIEIITFAEHRNLHGRRSGELHAAVGSSTPLATKESRSPACRHGRAPPWPMADASTIACAWRWKGGRAPACQLVKGRRRGPTAADWRSAATTLAGSASKGQGRCHAAAGRWKAAERRRRWGRLGSAPPVCSIKGGVVPPDDRAGPDLSPQPRIKARAPRRGLFVAVEGQAPSAAPRRRGPVGDRSATQGQGARERRAPSPSQRSPAAQS